MRHRRRGASAIEFALLLIPMTLILGGIIEFGWLFLQSNTLLMAARAGARAGAAVAETASPTPGDTAEDVARANLTVLGIDPGGVTINACVMSISAGGLNERALVVTLTQPYSPLTGLLGERVANLTLTEQSIMLIEQVGALGTDNC
jgi:Flp pilus assembly protein TadG